jgi:Ca2+-binding RTX toxin-like protein
MAVLRVPQDFASVSAAISGARSGDIIVVAAGYRTSENVTVSVNGLTIDSASTARINVTLTNSVTTLRLDGDGDVAVVGGTNFNDINGNAGDNWLSGNSRSNTLNGEKGVDNLLGGRGNDQLDGGAGFDYADYDTANGAVNVNLATGRSSGGDGSDTLRNIEAIRGSRFADALTGNSQDNALEGRRGSDRLDGAEGFDYAVYRNASGAVKVSLATGRSSGADGSDRLRNIEAIEGSRFADTLIGNAQENTLLGNLGNDLLDGGAGIDQASYLRASGAVNVNLTTGRSSGADGSDRLRNIEAIEGSRFADTLIGNARNNTLEGGRGNDRLDGRGGFDHADYVDASSAVRVNLLTGRSSGGDGSDTLRNIEGVRGSRFADTLIGDAENNALEGNAGDDVLNGGLGADTLDGGDDLDTADYSDRAASIRVTLNGANGASVSVGGIAEDILRNIENVRGGSGNDQLTGDAQNNVLEGNGGDDLLEGGLGVDTLVGGLGSDTYIVDNAGDVLTEEPGAGTDTVQSSSSYILGANLENIVLLGAAAINGTGNDLDNLIIGNSAANLLNGGLGADTLQGLDALDTLDGGDGVDTADYSEKTARVVATLAGPADATVFVGGTANDSFEGGVAEDTIRNIENIRGGSGDDWLTGDAQGNVLEGNDGDDRLDGGQGADTLIGGLGNDTYFVDNAGDVITEASGSGADTVLSTFSYTLAANLENLTLLGTLAINGTGNDGANRIIGNGAANVLNGGLGADTLIGGLGNDTYVVDNVGDVVTENAEGGPDTVQSTISYALGANLENLTLLGAVAINGIGNDLANVILGNAGANILQGLGGADILDGGDGFDTADYSEKTDRVEVTLDGANETTVLVGEDLGDEDTILNIENVRGGSGNDSLTGDAQNNVLEGNAGGDFLDGGQGADILIGGLGGDYYLVDNAGDVIIEAEDGGDDIDQVASTISYTLAANLENLFLDGTGTINGTGNDGANLIWGNGAANVLDGGLGADELIGGLGNDFLDGGGGADELTGSSGRDTFIYRSLSDSSGESTDLITDFASDYFGESLSDKIDLSALEGEFAFIGAAEFSNIRQVRREYDSEEDVTFVLVNGDTNFETAELIIRLDGFVSLAAVDFIL